MLCVKQLKKFDFAKKIESSFNNIVSFSFFFLNFFQLEIIQNCEQKLFSRI